MLNVREPAELTRVILATAVILKGCVWTIASPEIRLILIIAGTLALLDRWTRLAMGCVAVLGFYVVVSGQHYTNHVALMTAMTALAAFATPPATGFARDGTHFLMMVQISAVYFWAGAWKVNAAFLTGSILTLETDRSWLVELVGVSMPLPWVFAIATIVGEIVLAFALWIPNAVRWAFGLAAVLHVGMVLGVGTSYVVTIELLVFALLCASSFPLFAERARRLRAHTEPARTLS
jgi:hypothetical protein